MQEIRSTGIGILLLSNNSQIGTEVVKLNTEQPVASPALFLAITPHLNEYPTYLIMGNVFSVKEPGVLVTHSVRYSCI